MKRNKVKKNNGIIKLTIFAVSIIILITLIINTMARYQSEAETIGEIDIALYIINEDYQSMNLKLDSMTPREEPYIHNFSISNFNDIGKTDINLEYTVKIRTTTNLRLGFQLYKDQTYTSQGATNILEEGAVEQDEHDTYFRTFTAPKDTFGHIKEETKLYQLLIYFPETYNSIQYQDIIESIEIIIESRQKID